MQIGLHGTSCAMEKLYLFINSPLFQMAIQKQQQQRAEKVISLLQGNTSILKQVSVSTSQGSKSTGTATSPNTVVVKVGSGSTAQSNKKVRNRCI